MRSRTSILIGAVTIATLAIVGVHATGPYARASYHSDHHTDYHTGYGGHHEEGFFGGLWNRLGSWMPWGNKLGHDHVDTLAKVERIYQETHEEAQRRVDQLKEDIVKDSDIQKLIADIYHEEAVRAEREIEALKHPMLEWLLHWKKNKDQGHVSHSSDKAWSAAAGLGAKGMAEKLKYEVDQLPSKISSHYRTALESARTAAAALPTSASSTWEDTKQKASELYSHAFHKGHGETRTFLGKLRDSLGRIPSGTMHLAKSAVHTTWDFFTHALMAGFYLLLGAALAMGAFTLWRNRKFHNQLDARVSGPVIAVGEYMVVGNEEVQRKFYEFWSGPAAAYFNRQTGMRRQYMHRGVPGAGNMWLSYSEWSTIEDLRRAVKSAEFMELKRRAPKSTVHKMTLYQLGSTGDDTVTTATTKDTIDTRGLRQRGERLVPATATFTPAATYTTTPITTTTYTAPPVTSTYTTQTASS